MYTIYEIYNIQKTNYFNLLYIYIYCINYRYMQFFIMWDKYIYIDILSVF